MASCWICIQKAEWKAEKLNTVRNQAKILANEQNQTMAIIQETTSYSIINAANVIPGQTVIEFVSKY
jgi:hypothetical protein